MTDAQPTAVPEGRQPLFLSFAIALPVLDLIGWMGSGLAQSPNQVSAHPETGAHEALIYVAGASVILGLLFCVFSLARRESLRVLGFICLFAYLVIIVGAIAPGIWPPVH